MNMLTKPNHTGLRKDLQWISGLLCVMLVGTSLLTYALLRCTEERPATEALGATLAAAFSRNGLDNASELAPLKLAATKNPGGVTRPIPFLNISISNRDILNLPPREIRLRYFGQIANVIYRNGPEGLAALTTEREIKKSILDGGGVLKLVTAQTHQILARYFTPLFVASLFFTALLILFSTRLGRLIAPGIVLLITGAPGFALTSLLTKALKTNPAPPPINGSSFDTLSFVATNALPSLLPLIRGVYLGTTIAGGTLLILALLTKLLFKSYELINRSRMKTG